VQQSIVSPVTTGLLISAPGGDMPLKSFLNVDIAHLIAAEYREMMNIP
jgi:hypothetical protein